MLLTQLCMPIPPINCNLNKNSEDSYILTLSYKNKTILFKQIDIDIFNKLYNKNHIACILAELIMFKYQLNDEALKLYGLDAFIEYLKFKLKEID
ncbi:hypothetical protein [Campylobacter jejuni]|uniref:hypothetical protein n=1 Tax=Campylobacter jejuni TaxID=197 RepID=UPI000F8125B2|nr:hypothetical protein [Campylobacter jejuni]RTH92516.1 hypothetical protein C3I35_08010 [Campylobacter jejuni]